MITTTRTPDYMVNKVEGQVTIKELLDHAQANVDSWVSDPVLWDLTDASMAEDRSDYAAIRSMVSNIGAMVERRRGRKTAFVVADLFAYGMLRMAMTIVECNEDGFYAFLSRELESAKSWLMDGLPVPSRGPSK